MLHVSFAFHGLQQRALPKASDIFFEINQPRREVNAPLRGSSFSDFGQAIRLRQAVSPGRPACSRNKSRRERFSGSPQALLDLFLGLIEKLLTIVDGLEQDHTIRFREPARQHFRGASRFSVLGTRPR